MTIKILGTGCATCNALYETVKEAVDELDLIADVVKEEDLMKIMTYNVMTLPALVVDEQVVAKGKLSLSEVKKLLT
ncbi:MAG: thioredoxin family protein, partial [Alistipes sp.]